MKIFTIYANCQGSALGKTLLENESFSRQYNWEFIAPVQTLKENEIENVRKIFSHCDLIVYQHISEENRVKGLSTKDLLNYVKDDAQLISFPSLYFNGYFPHLDTLAPLVSVLNLVHDYFIVYAFIKGLSESDILKVLKSDNLYPKDLSISSVESSLQELKNRESNNRVDLKVSDYIDCRKLSKYQTFQSI